MSLSQSRLNFRIKRHYFSLIQYHIFKITSVFKVTFVLFSSASPNISVHENLLLFFSRKAIELVCVHHCNKIARA